MASRNYRDLVVWQKAIDLVDQVYEVTSTFPYEENFGLKSQLRRSAVSIPSNIAEGQGRSAPKEFLRFLNIGMGLLAELDTQIEVAKRQTMMSQEQAEKLSGQIIEIRKMLYGLKSSLSSKRND